MSGHGAAERAMDARRDNRTSMFLAAVLHAGSEQAPVKVRNMSSQGALIDTSLILSVGMRVVLMRGALRVQGAVMWSSEGRCGMRFSSEVPVNDWLATHNKIQQQQVDDMVALVRAGTPGPVADKIASPEHRSPELLAHDLGLVIDLMQDMEGDLTSCDETLKRHGMKLQNLDIAMQILRAVAGELVPAARPPCGRVALLRDGQRAYFPESSS